MKRAIAAALAALTAGAAASALELASTFSVTDLAFDKAKKSALSAAGERFPGSYAFGTNIDVAERIGDNILFAAGFERDPTLRNVVYTRIGYDAGFAKLSVGPFFGPFNTSGSALTSGISTNLRLEAAGVAFASFRADSTIGAGLAAEGDYVQQRSEVSVGVWVPNLILSARLASDSFTTMDSSILTLTDKKTRYEFIAEAYKKNVPYTVRLNMGYQELKRSYAGVSDTGKDVLGAAVMGLQVSMVASDLLRFNAGAEGVLYAWGVGGLDSPKQSKALYSVFFGMAYVIPSKKAGDDAAPGQKAMESARDGAEKAVQEAKAEDAQAEPPAAR